LKAGCVASHRRVSYFCFALLSSFFSVDIMVLRARIANGRRQTTTFPVAVAVDSLFGARQQGFEANRHATILLAWINPFERVPRSSIGYTVLLLKINDFGIPVRTYVRTSQFADFFSFAGYNSLAS